MHIFRREVGHNTPQLIVPIAERVVFQVLGVAINSDLTMTAHLDETVSSCASSMFILGILC